MKYYAGYEFYADHTVMIHVRNENSETINLFDKRRIPEKDTISTKYLLPMTGSLALMDLIFKKCEKLVNLTTKGPTRIGGGVILDEFNNYKVLVKEADEFNRIASNYSGDHRCSGFIITIPYLLKDLAILLPDRVTFEAVKAGHGVSRSLDEYYINNESIVCAFNDVEVTNTTPEQPEIQEIDSDIINPPAEELDTNEQGDN